MIEAVIFIVFMLTSVTWAYFDIRESDSLSRERFYLCCRLLEADHARDLGEATEEQIDLLVRYDEYLKWRG